MTLPPDDRDARRDDSRMDDDRLGFDRPIERPRLDAERSRMGFGRPRFDTPADRGEYDPNEEYEPDPEEYAADDFDDDDFDDADRTDDDFDDEYEDDDFSAPPKTGVASPVRSEPSLFAPVVFDDDEPRRFGRGGVRGGGRSPGRGGGNGEGGTPAAPAARGRYESDAGLLRILALIGVLGVVILALVLPFSPISVLGGDGDDVSPNGISARVSDDVPPLPEGLVALSRLYVITVQEGITGPLSVEVQLTESSPDGGNLAYYKWDGSAWTRVGSVQLAAGGGSVTGSIPAESASIAVLQRTALAHSMAMIVGAGETPDPAGLSSASQIVVTAATLQEDGSLALESAALRSAQQVAGDRPVLLGVSGDAGAAGVLGSAAASSQHVADLVTAAEAQDASGLYIEYSGVTDATGFTAFVTSLAQQLQAVDRQLIVGVPAQGDGFDWPGIAAVADGLWVQAPLGPIEYHRTVASLLSERGVSETSNVSIILDRRSAVATGDTEVAPISLIEALTIASTVDFNVDAIGAGSPVTMRTAYLGGGADRQLHWDDDANAVSFTYTANNTDSTVWFQNEYSFRFQLQAAQQGGFGGVAVRSASAGGSHPDVWEPVAAFVEEGTVSLLRPYGPYLTPCWEAPDGTIEGQPECWTTETDTTAVVWRAPQETGAYTVRLVVSEGTTFVGQEVVLRVGDTPEEEEPVEEATPEPTPEATETPEATPEATEEPTEEPSPEVTEEPTPEPTETAAPTDTPAPTSTAGPPGPGGN